MDTNRCDVCKADQVLTTYDPIDQKSRCSQCAAFVERLSTKDRQRLRELHIDF